MVFGVWDHIVHPLYKTFKESIPKFHLHLLCFCVHVRVWTCEHKVIESIRSSFTYCLTYLTWDYCMKSNEKKVYNTKCKDLHCLNMLTHIHTHEFKIKFREEVQQEEELGSTRNPLKKLSRIISFLVFFPLYASLKRHHQARHDGNKPIVCHLSPSLGFMATLLITASCHNAWYCNSNLI